ncbi:proline-rich protein 36-like isoform X3 [Schistocerca serialis cubense]|uniref:proline-rich protein 36-like isoform X3 n=1 Tax=Schistocerca serialis cubense TaxID=2023355 RepID=UPI00214ECCEE|nr:proline-rich protein 36-like isoform X3 [Schistocerca serialis cubense]
MRRCRRFVGPRGAVAGTLRCWNAVSRDRESRPRRRQAGGAPQPGAGHERRPRALLRPRLRLRRHAGRRVEQHRRQHHVPRITGQGQLQGHLHGHRERPVADRQAGAAAAATAATTAAAAAVLRSGAAAVVPRQPGQRRVRRCADPAAAASGAAGAVHGQPTAEAAARLPQLRQRRLAAARAVRPAVGQVPLAGAAGVRRGGSGGGTLRARPQAGAAHLRRRRGGRRRRGRRLRRRRPTAAVGAGQRRRADAAPVAGVFPSGAARRVQPVHQQGPRDPVAGVPAVERTAQAGAGEAEEVPQPAEQNAGARAAVRMPRRELRPTLLAVRRADEAHPHPHGAEAVPVPHLHALLLALRPPHDAHPHAHGGEALQLRRLRPQVRALRREEAARQGAPQAAHEEGEQAGDEHVDGAAAAAAAATATAAAAAAAGAAPPPPPVAPPPRPPARPPPPRTRPRVDERHAAGGGRSGAAGHDVTLSPTCRLCSRATTTTATITSRRRSRGRGRDRLRTRTRIRTRSRNRRRPRTEGGARRPPVAGSHRHPRPSSRLFALCVRDPPLLRLRQPLVGVQVQERHSHRSRRRLGGRRQRK